MNTDIQQIKRLLSLYYSGLTSVDDERKLRLLLASAHDLPEDIKAEADLILGPAEKNPVETPKELPQLLSITIDRLSHNERIGKRGSRWMALTGIAASVAIVASAIVFLLTDRAPSPYEVTDPEEASRMSVEALMTVAQGLRDADNAVKESYLILNKMINGKSPVDSLYPDSMITLIDTNAVQPGYAHPNRI